MAKYGTRNWAIIEQYMVSTYGILGRSGKQSRERWHNHLSELKDKIAKASAFVMQYCNVHLIVQCTHDGEPLLDCVPGSWDDSSQYDTCLRRPFLFLPTPSKRRFNAIFATKCWNCSTKDGGTFFTFCRRAVLCVAPLLYSNSLALLL